MKYGPMTSKADKVRFELLYEYPDAACFPLKNAVIQGFDYLFTDPDVPKEIPYKRSEFKDKYQDSYSPMMSNPLVSAKMFIGMRKSGSDIKPYLRELKDKNRITYNKGLLTSYPNRDIWEDLKDYISGNWDDVRIGFTELPGETIFEGRPVLFKHALVLVQEMKKDKIDTAPYKPAGAEAMKVYASLGQISNKIASWFRKNYDIKCQSIHPMGGDICTPPLVAKAGMGWFGRSGCVIMPEFGPRFRIAAVLLETKLFEYTDSGEHKWIEEYCSLCGQCVKNCPTGAVYEKKILEKENVQGIGSMYQCIDNKKCSPMHSKTVGCGICMRVCPFSKGKEAYAKLKKVISNRKKVQVM